MLSQMKQRYKRLPAKDKTQLIILVACVTISLYGFGAAILWQEMFEAEKLANRKANRIETRIGKIEEPKFDRHISEGNLNKLQAELAASYQEIQSLTDKFIAINDAEKLQALKLSISELADDVELDIQDFKVLNIKLKPGQEELAEYQDIRRQYYQRPYFALQAQSNFYALLSFIQALGQLDNIAIVHQLQVEYSGQGKLAISMKIMV